MRCWSLVNQSLTPSSWPTSPRNSSTPWMTRIGAPPLCFVSQCGTMFRLRCDPGFLAYTGRHRKRPFLPVRRRRSRIFRVPTPMSRAPAVMSATAERYSQTGGSMSQVVRYELRDGIGVITVDNPPVNALGRDVRAGLVEGLRQGLADAGAQALVVTGAGRTFPAGADIREFGQPPQEPGLPSVIDEYEQSDKLIVAAIHGTALGGGLEVALGCDYRVAAPTAKVGLPEVKLGILPGAGGTQRLPRLIGAQAALDMIVSGNHVPAAKAKELGIIDEIIEGDLVEGAIAYAKKLVAAKAPRRPIRDMQVKLDNPNLFEEFEASIAKRQRGFLAPFHCIKAVKAATELPIEQGLKREREL